jgi:hypothetical protein
MCFKWATEFQNASITSLDLHMEVFSQWVMWQMRKTHLYLMNWNMVLLGTFRYCSFS